MCFCHTEQCLWKGGVEFNTGIAGRPPQPLNFIFYTPKATNAADSGARSKFVIGKKVPAVVEIVCLGCHIQHSKNPVHLRSNHTLVCGVSGSAFSPTQSCHATTTPQEHPRLFGW